MSLLPWTCYVRLRLLPLLLLPLVAACDNGEVETGERNGSGLPPAPVVVAEVAAESYRDTIRAVGTARASESADITARVQGIVERVAFREGEAVAQGELLVAMDAAEEEAAVRAAEAAFEQAESRFARLESLGSRQLASRDALDEQAERVKTTRAELELARARLAQRRIRAPFSGMTGLREVSPGSLITPGTVITTLDAVETIHARFSIPEARLRYLARGNPVEASVPAWPEAAFSGEIITVDSRVDESSRAARIEAAFDNARGMLKPGMLMTLRARTEPRDVLFVPEAAVTPRDDRQFLWIVGADGESVQRREVRLGIRERGRVEIREGVSAGERVVVEGTANLRESRPIRIVERDLAGS